MSMMTTLLLSALVVICLHQLAVIRAKKEVQSEKRVGSARQRQAGDY
jgi:hypothetical protein